MAANRGEWAELYVIFKLLGEGKIYAADENLMKNSHSYLNIVKIIREEVKDRLIEYKTGVVVEICMDGETVLSVPATEFLQNAKILLNTINNSTGRSFDAEGETTEFKEKVLINSFKSPSVGYYNNFGGKNDIIMEVYDHATALSNVAGFSIKSKYKNPATLFNTAKSSAFVYELTDINDEQMQEVNSLVTSKGGRDKNARMDYFTNNNIGFNFSHVKIAPNQDHSVFADNLENVRGDMVGVLNEMILIEYFGKKKNSELTDIATTLIETNPLGKRNPEIYYIKAMKDFLYASFAGMTASHRWNGMAVVNGGYIVAKDTGEVLVYHTRDGESFRTFLYNNTKFDRPSSSENKYNYAFVYKETGRYYFDLNFQIRFIK